jgi:acid phosphatase family membrane protein YuiD
MRPKYEIVIVICIISLFTQFSCQFLKFLIFSGKNKKLMWHALFTTGGMPSSHTATVVAMTISLGLLTYWNDGTIGYEFSVALALTTVIMYDAIGVRYEAGKHAKILNQILNEQSKENDVTPTKPLKELLGHKPLEVLGGLVYGTVVATLTSIVYVLINS